MRKARCILGRYTRERKGGAASHTTRHVQAATQKDRLAGPSPLGSTCRNLWWNSRKRLNYAEHVALATRWSRSSGEVTCRRPQGAGRCEDCEGASRMCQPS